MVTPTAILQFGICLRILEIVCLFRFHILFIIVGATELRYGCYRWLKPISGTGAEGTLAYCRECDANAYALVS